MIEAVGVYHQELDEVIAEYAVDTVLLIDRSALF